MANTDIKAGNLVSVIIPVYNVEKYIKKCVLSLVSQNYKNIEIILVDDGTKDKSGAIIDDLAKMDERIKVLHKENGGVSSARNAGLLSAKGEYVVFVDGDDYVDENYVQYFLGLVNDGDYDIAMNYCNYNYKKDKQKDNDESRLVDSLIAIEDIYNGKIFVAVWNKIYKREFLAKNNIFFDERFWYGEGMLFNIVCLQYVDKLPVGNKEVYHQTFNPQSAMRNFNLESNHCGMRSMDEQKRLWKKSNKNIENAWNYHYRCFYYTILSGIIKTDSVEKYQQEYKLCLKKLRSDLSIPFKANIGFKERIIQLIMIICPVQLAKWSTNKEKRKYQVK